jgi:hypothetical protein
MKHSILFVVAATLVFGAAAQAAPILNPGNGNHYEFVPGNLTWGAANSAASGMTFLGQPGHLVTITSASENSFLLANFGTGQNSNGAWIGGQGFPGNVWRWVGGPEAGQQFSTGQTPTPPFNYANWGGIEPNNSGGVAWFNLGNLFVGQIPSGTWADAAFPGIPTGGDPVIGFIVEYETAGLQVPEPSSFLVWGIAAAGALLIRRRSNRRRSGLAT